jgi:regulator of protease activity HflC (stomatin/prohibitin superfamily)
MSWLTSALGIGKGLISGNYDSAIGSGLDFLDQAGPSLIKAYGVSQDQGNRNSAMEEVIQAMKDKEASDYAVELEAYKQHQAGSAAAAAAKRAALRKAQAIQQAYFNRSMKMLEPYIRAGKAELPIRQKAYAGSMDALMKFIPQNQEAMAAFPSGITAATPKITGE